MGLGFVVVVVGGVVVTVAGDDGFARAQDRGAVAALARFGRRAGCAGGKLCAEAFWDAEVAGGAVRFGGVGGGLGFVDVGGISVRDVSEMTSFLFRWAMLRCVYRCRKGRCCV